MEETKTPMTNEEIVEKQITDHKLQKIIETCKKGDIATIPTPRF